MAPSNLLMMPTDMMYLFCELYHFLAVSYDHIMFIFIIVLIFPIHRKFILKLFPLQLMNSTDHYAIKLVIVLLLMYFRPPWLRIKSNIFGSLLFSLVVCR